jgi:hypothetical protein
MQHSYKNFTVLTKMTFLKIHSSNLIDMFKRQKMVLDVNLFCVDSHELAYFVVTSHLEFA